MKSIAFTDKQEHVFTRFNALRRAYEDANGGGRVYNPDFLSVLMDAFEALEAQSYANPTLRASGRPQFTTLMVDNFLKQHFPLDPEPVSLRAYIADAEANDTELQHVRIKDSDNRYINNATIATTNLFMTHERGEAMVFDSPDEAKAFLRKWGRSAEGCIFEPVNETE